MGDCLRNGRNVDRFEPHMREHGLVGIDREVNNRCLQTLKNVRLRRGAEVREPRDDVTTRDYRRLKSKLMSKWMQTMKRKWRHFVVEIERSTKFRFGDKPYAHAETIFTLMIRGMILMDQWVGAGGAFWVEPSNFELQQSVLEDSVLSRSIVTWCTSLQSNLRKFVTWPTENQNQKILAACRALVGVFPPLHAVETQTVFLTMRDTRLRLIQSRVRYLEWVKASEEWSSNSCPVRLADQAHVQFDKWVRSEKQNTLHRLRQNLLRRFTSEFRVTEEETCRKAGLDSYGLESDNDTEKLQDCSDSDVESQAGLPVIADSATLVGTIPTSDTQIVPTLNTDESAFLKR
ncbi:hypothetical protein R1sor_015675 [Riccia sorocarpa]|uniref:Uncharacterized protein n=1 Tax=Riccia sorocarpa TaxID=122646 RepID=A0ABD3HH17_9MARC